jgi:hypothetical protein
MDTSFEMSHMRKSMATDKCDGFRERERAGGRAVGWKNGKERWELKVKMIKYLIAHEICESNFG